jgi:hypothetical protein
MQTHSQPYILAGTFTAGTSPTWDGRKRLLPASSDKASPNYWPAALLLLAGLAGCCFCTIYATRLGHAARKRVKPLSPREQQGNLFFAAWATCCADRSDLAAVRSMDTIVRRWLKIEAVLPQDLLATLEDKAAAGAAAVILTHCERVLFAQVVLSDQHCGEIATGGKVLFPEASRILSGSPHGNPLTPSKNAAPQMVSKEV